MSDRVAVIGPGRMGLALGSALHQADALERLTLYGRSPEPPPHPLMDSDIVEYRRGVEPPPPETTILILAVPEEALHDVVNEVSRAGRRSGHCVALHLSGVLSTDILAPLHGAGYTVGSLHPLQTVADPWSGAERLRGCAYAIAGEPGALTAARRIVDALDGRALVIPPALRPVVHAAAVFASSYVLVAAATIARVLAEAGIDEDEAIAASTPLMRGTIDTVEHLGLGAALTGPVARGDLDTVRLHLSRLSPRERRLYSALGLETVELARGAGLDPARADALEALLAR
jgi:predicted short-subunit dehydrogenase-like oxidoreductase (DUF2520 family)